MKNLLAALALISAVLLFGCDDAIKSDPDKIERRADFGVVKSDQTKDVIMPLSVGRTWYFSEIDYDQNGNVSFVGNDSIVVLSEVSLRGEKWFNVQLTAPGNEDSRQFKGVMTNTSTGLWFKYCDTCDASLTLMAQYPVTSSPYLGGPIEFLIPKEDHTELSKDATLFARTNAFNNELIGDKLRSGVKYEYYVNDPNGVLNHVTLFSDKYTENFGMVQHIVYSNMSAPVERQVYTHIEKLEPPEERILQTPDTIDWNIQGYNGEIDSTVKIAINISKKTVATINSIIFTGDVALTYDITALPVTLNPGQNLDIRLTIKKKQSGSFTGTLTLVTSVGNFEIPVVGYYL